MGASSAGFGAFLRNATRTTTKLLCEPQARNSLMVPAPRRSCFRLAAMRNTYRFAVGCLGVTIRCPNTQLAIFVLAHFGLSGGFVAELSSRLAGVFMCKECGSTVVKEMHAEMALHFYPNPNLEKPQVFVFPTVRICSQCGLGEFVLTKSEFAEIGKNNNSKARAATAS